jgi:predicted membrane protein
MAWTDAAGLAGVLIILAAYAAATVGRLDPRQALSLFANFLGASLILVSLLVADFNLSATVMEGAWALVALAGLVRLGVAKLQKRKITASHGQPPG